MAKKPTAKKKSGETETDADIPFSKTVTQLTKDKKPLGRPTKYSKEVADDICEAIATTKDSLATICKPLDIKVVSVFEWLDQYKEFAVNYARAREVQAEMMFDELREVAFDASGDIKKTKDGVEYVDHENIQRSRLKVDTLKWAMSKLLPKRFGDKLDVTSGGNAMAFRIGYKKADNKLDDDTTTGD